MGGLPMGADPIATAVIHAGESVDGEVLSGGIVGLAPNM
ncbi:hypothetical protein CCICO_09195 [Corynebacterium ciconiae DSM 44920]|nr:hypothetical protein CCICO_09195 [Corynebacterium ciconiae DSM 44920]